MKRLAGHLALVILGAAATVAIIPPSEREIKSRLSAHSASNDCYSAPVF